MKHTIIGMCTLLTIIFVAALVLNILLITRIRKTGGDRRLAVSAVLTFAAASDILIITFGVPFTLKNYILQADNDIDLHRFATSTSNGNSNKTVTVTEQTRLGCFIILFRTSSILFQGFHVLYRITIVNYPTFAYRVFNWTSSIFTIPGEL